MVLASLVDQLPVQVGEDWAAFSIICDADERRQMAVGFNSKDGLRVRAQDWDGDDPQRAQLARDRGWQRRSYQWWKTSYPDPDRAEAASAARLLVAELNANNFTDPEALRLHDVSCADHGFFQLPGIGVG